MLETLLNGLRDLHRNHQKSDGRKRGKTIQKQAEYACTFARKNSILIEPDYSFDDLITDDETRDGGDASVTKGSEHVVELDAGASRVVKITIPNGFGLTPKLLQVKQAHAHLRAKIKESRPSIEFVPATPLEYLSRWHACNELFNDDVRLCDVILWPNQRVSLSISQPVYAGSIPTNADIETYFSKAGWTRINNASGHGIFYDYASEVMALDIEPRNCYISYDGELLPFDVILSEPDDELSDFLKLY